MTLTVDKHVYWLCVKPMPKALVIQITLFSCKATPNSDKAVTSLVIRNENINTIRIITVAPRVCPYIVKWSSLTIKQNYNVFMQ